MRPVANRGLGLAACILLGLPLAGARQGGEPAPLFTGRCLQDLPLDAGQTFDDRRFLLLGDRMLRFLEDGIAPGRPWRLESVTRYPPAGPVSGLLRARRKWRDGALWALSGTRILRWDPGTGRWEARAEPSVEFMDFEVDMGGRILLVCTADPATRRYRALLEAVERDGRSSTLLEAYPDSGAEAWARRVPPVAAATLQVGYESVQIHESMVLFNPLARRLFLFNPLEDRLREVRLGLPVRGFGDLASTDPPKDLCWQVLPKGPFEAWLVLGNLQGGLQAIPLDLREARAGEPEPLEGLSLPVFPGPSGRLENLAGVLRAFTEPSGSAEGSRGLGPSAGAPSQDHAPAEVHP